MFFFQVPFAGFISLSADLEPLLTVAWVCRHHQRRQPDRRARRPRRRDRRHRGRGVLPLQPPALGDRAPADRQHRTAPGRDLLRDLPRVPAPQRAQGQDLHGRRGRAVPRVADGHVDHGGGRAHGRRLQRSEVLFFAPIFIPFVILGVPMLDTGFAVVRRTLKRARGEGTKVLEAGGQAAPPPPADGDGARSPPGGRDPVGVDDGALGAGALPDLLPARQRGDPDRHRRRSRCCCSRSCGRASACPWTRTSAPRSCIASTAGRAEPPGRREGATAAGGVPQGAPGRREVATRRSRRAGRHRKRSLPTPRPGHPDRRTVRVPPRICTPETWDSRLRNHSQGLST